MTYPGSSSPWSPLTTYFLLTFLLPLLICFPQISKSNSSCEGNQLTVYKVILTTYWSRQLFPKHYPDWRPKAQFSKLVGRSHNADFKLFRMDEECSEGVRIFAETGVSDNLNELSQGEGGMYDAFTAAPPTPKGVGRTETEFFVDGNHSKVSLMSRLIPSPDWFIGIDSVDLCNQGNWVTSLTVQVDPLDAGSDDGLTFTAPNWPTNPRGVITKLTARLPNHPASSFFYTDKESLPSIASFQFIKVKEYELNQLFNSHQDEERGSRIKSNDVIDSHSSSKMYPPMANLKMAMLSAPKPLSITNNYVDYFTQLDSPQPEKKPKKQIKRDEKRKAKSKLQSGNKCPANSVWCRRRHNHRTLFNW